MLNLKNSTRSAAPHAAKRNSDRSTARAKEPNFGEVIRTRRREMDLTQDEVASRIKTSTPYVGHLESSKRHPSEKIVTRLAEVLGFANRELFCRANPYSKAFDCAEREWTEDSVSARDYVRKSKHLQRIYNVSNDEI